MEKPKKIDRKIFWEKKKKTEMQKKTYSKNATIGVYLLNLFSDSDSYSIKNYSHIKISEMYSQSFPKIYLFIFTTAFSFLHRSCLFKLNSC